MLIKLAQRKKIFFGKKSVIIVILTLFLLPLITNHQLPFSSVSGHSALANPKQLYSIWNDTSPTIDGVIEFNHYNLSFEWSSAAIYWLYDDVNNSDSKILVQNNNSHLFLGLDIVSMQTADTGTTLGCSFYFDRDHNGLVTSNDRAIRIVKNSLTANTTLLSFNQNTQQWDELESAPTGTALSNGLIGAYSFTDSSFESNNHYQFEVVLPFTSFNLSPGNITGFAVEAFEDIALSSGAVTWPYVEPMQEDIRTDAYFWGDLTMGTNLGNPYYSSYLIEDNFYINSTAYGVNNGTFIEKADVDGNGDYELVVCSNRSVTGEDSLVAIYDFIDGKLTKIWWSWSNTTIQELLPVVRDIGVYDFDENGEEEIYLIGNSEAIFRLSDWNAVNTTLDSFTVIYNTTENYPSTYLFTSTLAICDVDNDGLAEIATSYVQSGEARILILKYNSGGDFFDPDDLSDDPPPAIGGTIPYKILEMSVADADNDGLEELLVLSQISADDSNATYRLQILRKGILFGYVDNDDNDNLPSDSVAITQDRFGHTIIVADVDNDALNETIIVGKDYLKIFGNESYLQSAPPLTLLLNDGVNSPYMAGGALVTDIDQDSDNELLVGCNNGTLLILEITDSGSDTLSYSILYRNDYGSSLGKRSSIEFFDYDNDGSQEIIFSDNFGKITILGYGSVPTVAITSPSMDAITSLAAIEISWDAQAFVSMHHFDLYVNNIFVGRAGAGQTKFLATLIEGENLVNITCFDILGNNSSDYIRITQSLAPPSVIISSPIDGFLTRASSVQVDYSYFDPGDNFDHVEIYRNGSVVEASTTATTYLVPLPTDGIWNITVVAEDTFGNRGKDEIFVIRDNTSPQFSGQTIIGSQVLGNGNIEVQSSDSIVLSTTISDNFEIQQVNATVSGEGYNETFIMTLQSGTPATGAVYTVSLNLSALELGNYRIQILVVDDAGNTESQSYNFTLVNLIAIPWILQGYNLYYVAGGSLATIILVTLLAVAIRRRVVNLGWQREIVAVSYIFNGLPCVYIQNVPELVKDELLFGGALTGIRGILEEITGEKSTLEVQTVEMNQKIVLICPGEFGDAVLMVNKIKPIHKTKLIEFTKFFEKEYRHTLKQEDQIFTPETFRAASILVESFFGINENIQLVDECDYEVIEESPDIDLGTRAIAMDQLQDLPPTPQETTARTEAYPDQPEVEATEPSVDRGEPITKKMEPPKELSVESLIRQLPQQSQNVMIYTIELTQNAINSLLERKFDDAARISTIIIENLEQLLTSGTTNKQIDMVIKALLSITSVLYQGIEAGQKDNEPQLKIAAEKASEIWMKEIVDRW